MLTIPSDFYSGWKLFWAISGKKLELKEREEVVKAVKVGRLKEKKEFFTFFSYLG